jgi:hypothetical protein
MKALPPPRFQVMSQQEIILAKARLEAEQRLAVAANALLNARTEYKEAKKHLSFIKADPDQVVDWHYLEMDHAILWKRYCFQSGHPYKAKRKIL